MTVQDAAKSGQIAEPPREQAGAHSREQSAEVVALLRRIIRASDIQSKRLLKETGLTAAQVIALQAIRDMGEVTTGDLSRYANLSQSTVTMILDRLERKHLIERYRSNLDRRVVHARLTPPGLEILTTAPALLNDTITLGFARKSERDQSRIIRALHDVAKLLESAPSIDDETLDSSTDKPSNF